MAVRYATPVNTFAEYNAVFKAKLGPHRLIYGAEIDGIDADGRSCIELKTIHKNLNQEALFGDRYIKFWAQSFLVNIEKILIGKRNDRGILTAVDCLMVPEIPRLVRGKVSWCPEMMLNFATELITWIKSKMENVEDDKVYRLSFNGSTICLSALDNHPSFIPASFSSCFYY